MSDWPELSPERDHETLTLLHLAAQMLGKIRVAHAPWMNHGWHVALQPNARGLATLPTAASDGRTFTLTLDLCRHAIVLWASDESREELPLNAGSIAALHHRLIALLDRHGLPSTFNGMPNEIEGAIPFAEDTARRDYDRDFADRFREALAAVVPVFALYRAGFAGKASPVQFWWGGFDLAVNVYSGREAPPHPGRDAGPARSHHARGLQPRSDQRRLLGGRRGRDRADVLQLHLSRARRYRDAKVAHGRFDDTLGEFVLPYAEVRAADDPKAMLGEFLQSAYDAAADLAKWDRAMLEREPVAP